MKILLFVLSSCSHSSMAVEKFFLSLCEESLKSRLDRKKLESFYGESLKQEIVGLSHEEFIDLFSSQNEVLSLSIHYNSCFLSYCKILYTVQTKSKTEMTWITKELRLKKHEGFFYVYEIKPISSRYQFLK